MKLVSFGPAGLERPGVVDGTDIIDLRAADPSIPHTTRGILADDLLDHVARLASTAGKEARLDAREVKLGPPVTNPSKIICLGMNYREHAAEQNREPPEFPMLFSKAPNVLVGQGGEVPYPRGVEQLDYEVELAFVIGRRGRHIPRGEAR
ncbi:MAG: fumarylacetoacetate hydrolase family protein, partial [Candidatus Krumholzibacteriota bacterium]|nr:fumarylacetoacetate hydrolase family protein [Candidatus Krumholzibacteriota bacterium]